MDGLNYSLDTYALIEISKGNPKFQLLINKGFILNDLILAEFYSVILRNEGQDKADYWFNKLKNYSFPVNKELLVEAVKFRHKHKKTGISFFDSVGYIFSLKKGCKFVTGDKEFENFSNVKFIKK